MDFWQETNWFAIQTKPCQETLAAAHAAKLDAEVFLPRVKLERLIGGFVRHVTKPLFPGYFFARFCPLLSYDLVRYARGVLRVVGTTRFPIPLDAEVIAAVQDRVQSDGLIELETKSFRPGEIVTIDQGPFAGWMGQVEREWDDGRRVMILLNAIHQARLLLEKRWLSAVTNSV